MTTKPKTRKAPAARAIPKPTPKEANGELKRKVSEIGRLVSRWHWLEADQGYQAETAETETESERLIAIHNDEQEEIERKLASLVPENFLDLCTLLGRMVPWLMAPSSTCSRMHGEVYPWHGARN